MAAAITAFLQTATLLCQHVIHVRDDAVVPAEGADDPLQRFTRDFEDLADRLARRDRSSLPRNTIFATEQLARACRKVCLDTFLRLSRTIENGLAEDPPRFSYGLVWTEVDTEAFRAHLVDFSSQWKQIFPADSDIASTVSQTLSNLRASATDKTAEKVDQEHVGIHADTQVRRPVSMGLLADFILESLSFRTMRNREEEVAEAHENTFDWVFKYTPGHDEHGGLGDQFSTWLRSDTMGSIYWVTGKPGAGKSTLMRYIAEHKNTEDLLKRWAGGRPLAQAVFYFWTSGSEEQRSQAGLLRYLLHQLLSYDLDLAPKVFPALWQKLSYMTTKDRIRLTIDWSVAELMEAFQRYVQYALESRKICLFVDGLDEFDGDHKAIIQFFKNLVEQNAKDRIKLCLSSRPWPVFEQAFEYSVPNLKLQDLTFHDMKKYVEANLAKHDKLKDAFSRDGATAEAITRAVVQRSDGVFLWVRLVARKVLEIFENRPDLIALQEFITELPSDLDELFTLFLFKQQSEEGLQESAHIFHLVRAREVVANFVKDDSANALSIWELFWALSPQSHGAALGEQVRESADLEIWEQSKATLERVASSSTGLLEVYTRPERGNRFQSKQPGKRQSIGKKARRLAESRVTYLHRTVRDYLVSDSGTWDALADHASDIFDPHLRLVRSHVLRLKNSIEPIEHHRRLDEWYPDIALSLTHARYVSNDMEVSLVSLINKLDNTISWYWQSKAGDPYDHWARTCFGTYEQRKGNKIVLVQPFLALCTKFGLRQYVRETLDALAESKEGPSDEDRRDPAIGTLEETPLLTYALEFLTSRQKTIMPLSSPTFVSELLHSPHRNHPVLGDLIGSPNMVYDSPLSKAKEITPWILVLRHLRDAKRRGWIEPFDISFDGTMRWTQIVGLLSRDGADLNAFLKWNGFDEECYASDVLVQQLGKSDDWWIHKLKGLFAES